MSDFRLCSDASQPSRAGQDASGFRSDSDVGQVFRENIALFSVFLGQQWIHPTEPNPRSPSPACVLRWTHCGFEFCFPVQTLPQSFSAQTHLTSGLGQIPVPVNQFLLLLRPQGIPHSDDSYGDLLSLPITRGSLLGGLRFCRDMSDLLSWTVSRDGGSRCPNSAPRLKPAGNPSCGSGACQVAEVCVPSPSLPAHPPSPHPRSVDHLVRSYFSSLCPTLT